MRKIIGVCIVSLLAGLSAQAVAQDKIVEAVVAACEQEIKNYCSQVTPGEGRVLACFYAHEDKLSVQCINALYDGMAALERFVSTVSYVAGQCSEDIDNICGKTVPGEGRIAQCLLDNEADLTETCSAAITDVGLRVE